MKHIKLDKVHLCKRQLLHYIQSVYKISIDLDFIIANTMTDMRMVYPIRMIHNKNAIRLSDTLKTIATTIRVLQNRRLL